MAAACALPITRQTRLLVVAPHPDDETLAAGVLMQQVLAAGGAVDVLLLTDGDNNPWPQRAAERRVRIDAAARRRWGRRRRGEIAAAMRALGLEADRLHALGWPDLGLTALALQPRSAAVARLADALARLRPTLVVMPALADRHPDHGSAHVLLRLALAASALAPCVWTYFVHAPRAFAAPVEIRGDAGQRAAKRAALGAHASQLALSARRLQRLAGDERFQPLSAAAPPGAGLPWHPPRLAARWLCLGLVGPSGATRWRWPDAPVARAADGTLRLAADGATAPGPRFARLESRLRSPWIFDHWGWCELA